MNKVIWKVKAVRQLRKVKDAEKRGQIYSAVGGLASFPDCPEVRKLTKHKYPYRLRVGNYRVFFDFQGGEATIIFIEEVRKRDENTY